MKCAQFLATILLTFCFVTMSHAQLGYAQPLYYEGVINKTISVKMVMERAGNKLTGSYQYVKFGKDIRLEGYMPNSDHFVLNEYNGEAKQTGVFRGRFAGFVEPIDGIMGEWSSPDGTQRLPFELQRVEKPYNDIFTGIYKRVNHHEADLKIWFKPNIGLYAKGEATWRGISDNVHQGSLDGVCRIIELNKAVYDEGGNCRLVMQFTKEGLVITEDKGECYGANVSFNGDYKRLNRTPTEAVLKDKKNK